MHNMRRRSGLREQIRPVWAQRTEEFRWQRRCWASVGEAAYCLLAAEL